MTLTLHYHPLSSFCWKALIALYETGAPFTPHIVHLNEPAARAAFLKLWPMGKFPVLEDSARGLVIPESSIVIEYLAQHYPGESALLAADPELARRTRLRDRFLDLYVHQPMQAFVADLLRPEGQRDRLGIERARATMETAYDMLEAELGEDGWAMGETFTMADCAAAPALYYGNVAAPIGARPRTQAYLRRLMTRPSFARVLKEAEPFFQFYPMNAARLAAYS